LESFIGLAKLDNYRFICFMQFFRTRFITRGFWMFWKRRDFMEENFL